eukprot:275123_1
MANEPNKKKPKKKCPWRAHLPHDAVDPISLEPLHTLPYPPFALQITPPYTPIPIWPVPVPVLVPDKVAGAVSAKEENHKLLSEQWGDLTLLNRNNNLKNDNVNDDNDDNGDNTNDQDKKEGKESIKITTKDSQPQKQAEQQSRHYHLFDGKVLAFYLVSELQFIDPLNRRDLTREELLNLDRYLQTHRLQKMNVSVVSAYDDKGISVSTAGAAGQTREGRLRIRQEEARGLLNSLFQQGGTGTGRGQGQGRG